MLTLKNNSMHELKILPEYLTAVLEGKKTFEVRKKDRDYKVGDKLYLREWDGSNYTDRFAIVDVTYILDNPEYVKDDFVILGIKNTGNSEAVKFACAVDKVIGLPGAVCEVYEKAFKEGKYEEIVRNLVNFYKR